MSTRVAPIFPVTDLAASLAYYRGLGFGARPWSGGGYGFLTFDGAEIHLGEEPDLATRPDRRSTAYLFVEDADALAQTWVATGADVRLPEDTTWSARPRSRTARSPWMATPPPAGASGSGQTARSVLSTGTEPLWRFPGVRTDP